MPKIRLKEATVQIHAPNDDASEFTVCDIHVGDGKVSWSEKRAVEYVLDRGAIFHADQEGANAGLVTAYTRWGDEQPLDLSFDMIFDYYSLVGDTSTAIPYGPVELLKGIAALEDPADIHNPYIRPNTKVPYLDASCDFDDSYDPNTWDDDYSDLCAPYCVDVLVKFIKTCRGSEVTEQYLFKYFRWTSINYDIGAGQLSFSGQCQTALAITHSE